MAHPPDCAGTRGMDFDIEAAVRDEVLAGILAGRDVEEELLIRIKPGFNTGCWTWVPPHRIYIGSGIFDNPQVREGLTDEQKVRYTGAYVRHEQGHAQFTERDLKAVQSRLKSESLPFGLWNLFEDARMEAHYRRKHEIRFGWLEFERSDFDPEQVKSLPMLASAMLFALIQSEGEISAESLERHAAEVSCSVCRDEARGVDRTAESVAKSVLGYYTEACAQRDALGLLPIMRRWADEFGLPPPQESGGAGGAGGDLELSMLLQADPEAREQFEQGTKDINGKEIPGGKKTPEELVDLPEGGTSDLLVGHGAPIDERRVAIIVRHLRKLFQERIRVEYTETPAKRISARHCATERPPYRHRTVTGTARRRFELVVDCSGSMSGLHIEEGRVLIAALSTLAREGKVEGHVILSVGHDTFHWQRFRLPMSLESIGKIAAFGAAEGLEYTLRSNIDVLRGADFVCVYTDGCITDRPIQKDWLHQRGIHTTGLYVGDAGYLSDLQRYFDRSLIREDIEALAGAMLTLKRS